MTTWTKVGSREAYQDGVDYRLTLYFTVPYSETVANIVLAAINAAKIIVRLSGQVIDSVQTFSPELTSQDTNTARYPRWSARIHFHKG